MEKQVLKFAVEKETKNTFRYAEQSEGKPPVLGTVYVQKWVKPPAELTVTIEG
jgi:hypothetical protein